MALVQMNQQKPYEGYEYSYKETLTSSGSGDAIRIPGGEISSVAYDLEGDGTVEVTNYTEEDIDGNSAVWRTVNQDDLINPSITAIRHTNVSGTTVFIVRCQ